MDDAAPTDQLRELTKQRGLVGEHPPGLVVPGLLVGDIRAFFRALPATDKRL